MNVPPSYATMAGLFPAGRSPPALISGVFLAGALGGWWEIPVFPPGLTGAPSMIG